MNPEEVFFVLPLIVNSLLLTSLRLLSVFSHSSQSLCYFNEPLRATPFHSSLLFNFSDSASSPPLCSSLASIPPGRSSFHDSPLLIFYSLSLFSMYITVYSLGGSPDGIRGNRIAKQQPHLFLSQHRAAAAPTINQWRSRKECQRV